MITGVSPTMEGKIILILILIMIMMKIMIFNTFIAYFNIGMSKNESYRAKVILLTVCSDTIYSQLLHQ